MAPHALRPTARFDRVLPRLAVLVLSALAWPVLAHVVSFTGELDDSGNTALVAFNMTAAQFSDDLATANNVALHVLHVAVGGSAQFTSTGFAGGGIDPYFTLFSGSDPATATLLISNYDHAWTLGGDFSLGAALAPGDYTLAIGAFANMSFAENLGGGVLADGFIGLGEPAFFGDGRYAFSVTLPDAGSVPEPSDALLASTAALTAAWASRRRRRCI